MGAHQKSSLPCLQGFWYEMLFLQRKNFEKLCSIVHLNSNCLACFYVPSWNSYKFGNFYARAMISTFLELAWTYQSYGMISKYTLSGNCLSKIGLFEVHCIFQVKKLQKKLVFTKTSLFFLDFLEMFHFFHIWPLRYVGK